MEGGRGRAMWVKSRKENEGAMVTSGAEKVKGVI